LTQSEIAKIVGLSQQHVSRVLGLLIMRKTKISVVSEWLQKILSRGTELAWSKNKVC
jgi:DNA-directed RNA polymerase specialized sigma subunit